MGRELRLTRSWKRAESSTSIRGGKEEDESTKWMKSDVVKLQGIERENLTGFNIRRRGGTGRIWRSCVSRGFLYLALPEGLRLHGRTILYHY